MRSESEPGDSSDAKDFGNRHKFETAAGRGIYTSQSFHKALQYGVPIFWDGVPVRAKMVLLTILPGDSQQELGTLFKIAIAKSKSMLWQADETQPISPWQIIPTRQFEQEVLNELNVDAAPEGILRRLRNLGKSFRPPSLVKLVDEHQFDSFPHLQCRTLRKEMQNKNTCWPYR